MFFRPLHVTFLKLHRSVRCCIDDDTVRHVESWSTSDLYIGHEVYKWYKSSISLLLYNWEELLEFRVVADVLCVSLINFILAVRIWVINLNGIKRESVARLSKLLSNICCNKDSMSMLPCSRHHPFEGNLWILPTLCRFLAFFLRDLGYKRNHPEYWRWKGILYTFR